MAPACILTYFNVTSAGEPIRFILAYGGIDFEDRRIEYDLDEWPKFKPKTPFGALPIIEVDGKVVNQSLAICRYFAKKLKLVGENDWEDLQIDALVDTINDLRLKFSTWYYDPNVKVKAARKDPLFKEEVPFYLERLNKISKNGHFFGDRLTWADLFLAALAHNFNAFAEKDWFVDYPNLQAVIRNVTELPAINKWLAERPYTEF